jgi:hypothetical protein
VTGGGNPSINEGAPKRGFGAPLGHLSFRTEPIAYVQPLTKSPRSGSGTIAIRSRSETYGAREPALWGKGGARDVPISDSFVRACQ